MRILLICLAIPAIAYGALVVYALLFADQMLFHPLRGSFRTPERLVKVRGENGETLAAVLYPNPSSSQTIWYFHGNAEDLGDTERFLCELHARGYAVFAVDYPGYGLNPGRTTEAGIYASTRAGLRYLREECGVETSTIIAFGRSLGGGPAVELAANEPIAGLILESAFSSAFRVVMHWKLMPFDKFDNLRKIPRVQCPVLIMHGREDRVVPFTHGEALFAAALTKREHLWVDGAGHNDLKLVAEHVYWDVIQSFTQTLSEVGGSEGVWK